MGGLIHLDTHAVVWLYTAELDRFTDEGRRLLDSSDLEYSAMVELELTYLQEIGRLTVTAADVMHELIGSLGLRASTVPFADVVRIAHSLNWTRDPFDRLIVADALAARALLLTKDERIAANSRIAVW